MREDWLCRAAADLVSRSDRRTGSPLPQAAGLGKAAAVFVTSSDMGNAATSVEICKIDVRNCDIPVSKDEIALLWEPELARESRACQTPSHAAAPAKPPQL